MALLIEFSPHVEGDDRVVLSLDALQALVEQHSPGYAARPQIADVIEREYGAGSVLAYTFLDEAA